MVRCKEEGCVFKGTVTYVFPILGLTWCLLMSATMSVFGATSNYVKADLLTDDYMNKFMAVSIATAFVLIFLIPIIGICLFCLPDADSEPSLKLVYSYLVLLFVAMIMEGSVAPLVLQVRDEVRSSSKARIPNALLPAYSTHDNSSLQLALDKLQRQFHCCGGRNMSDYIDVNIPIPDSCCHHSNCTSVNGDDFSAVYSKGCSTAMANKMSEEVIGYVTIVALLEVFQIISIFLTLKVRRTLLQGRRRGYDMIINS